MTISIAAYVGIASVVYRYLFNKQVNKAIDEYVTYCIRAGMLPSRDPVPDPGIIRFTSITAALSWPVFMPVFFALEIMGRRDQERKEARKHIAHLLYDERKKRH